MFKTDLRKEGNKVIIQLRAIGNKDHLDDFGCDDPEAIRLIVDFL